MTTQFVHLKLHTEYSLCDGLTQIQPLIDLTHQYQMGAVAMTDLSNLFAVVKFYQEAINRGIKPIIGADIWLENPNMPTHPSIVTLLCQNNTGYQNLLKLLTQSYLKGQQSGKPIARKAWLIELGEGLIVLSGGKEGDLGKALLTEDTQLIQKSIHFWQTHFPNRFYLELQRTGRLDEEIYNQHALNLAVQYGVPVVATNDVRFLEKEDFEAHEARVCIHQGDMLADPRRSRHYSEQQYFRSSEEMETLFHDIPEALINSVEIAKRCNVHLTLGKISLPRYEVPEGFDCDTYLIDVAKKGLANRLKKMVTHLEPSIYENRLQHELDVIIKMGFAGYFLIVADFTSWARNNQVPVGPGRGSGPGSLVAYSLYITDLDPLAHELLFERFLNPERVSMPDFDIDFCMEGRDRVIDYVMKKQGLDSVAQIITYGTMAAKAVVRDVGRVLGMNYGFVDKIAKLIPFELGITLEKALEQEEILRARYQKEEEVKTLIDLARKLEGTTRNVGKHAGGVVIAPNKLTDFTPLYCEANELGHVVTQFDKDDVEAVGLVKFDFLGLRTLTIIHWAIQQINHQKQLKNESALDIHFIPMNDAATFDMLKACKTTAVFQLESRGMKDLVKRLQPDCFEDIVALVALFRPGPLQSGMVDDFINRKHGRAKVFYPHPQLESILRPTYGVILYQEQVMQIAQVLAGYTLGAADLLRRAMGKKKPEEMALQREIFCKGSVTRGVKLDVAQHIFDLMEKFAGYGFNKSHSASYALISYQTAWLKAHYPAAYMASVLSADMDHTDKVVLFVVETESLGIKVIPPHINHSDYMFKVVDEKNISYGLGAIKGVGQAAIDSIIAARSEGGPFQNLFDFCNRIDLRKVNRRVLEALIKSGAFDDLGTHRASLFASLDMASQQSEQLLRDKTQGQQDLFGGKLTSPLSISYVRAPIWSEQERLFGEKETLGLYLTGHPIHPYLEELKQIVVGRLAEVRTSSHHKTVIIAGIIQSVRMIQTKRGDRMAVATLDDASSQMDMLCFPDIYHQFRELLVKDTLIIVEGEISMDDFTNQYRMVSREIFSIDKARERYAKCLNIKLSPKTQDIQRLATLLEKFRGGNCQVRIDYTRNDAKAQLQLAPTWNIKPTDDLLKIIREQIQESEVQFIY